MNNRTDKGKARIETHIALKIIYDAGISQSSQIVIKNSTGAKKSIIVDEMKVSSILNVENLAEQKIGKINGN